MFKCMCGKEVKTKSALTNHQKKCSEYQEALDVPEIKELIPEATDSLETTKEVKVTETIPEVKKELTDIQMELIRRIEKQKVSIRSCFDAEVRHRLECELKELEAKLG